VGGSNKPTGIPAVRYLGSMSPFRYLSQVCFFKKHVVRNLEQTRKMCSFQVCVARLIALSGERRCKIFPIIVLT
jgi:hypothetical protein